jgi:molybdenum cofactor cytidylyltransferase
MGEPKGLVNVDGRPWVLWQLDRIARAGTSSVSLVLGADRERYLSALPDLVSRVRVVVNPEPDRGPFSSLQCGLAVTSPAAPVFVLPIDVPAAEPSVWRALLDALPPGTDAAVPEMGGRGGHPVLLAPDAVARLRSAPSSSRLDAELAAFPRVARISVADPAIRLNLNAPEDWGKLERGH